MKTNLIQNFIHHQNNQPTKKEATDFDIHHELASKTFIKPLQGQGRLIKSNLLDAPNAMVKGITYDIASLSHGVKGDANDHELGKLNDLGMKVGGLAIAGYLFTKRQAPITKTMEFVGLGSFFASMALWPKLAIQLPARLIHGFNVQQQYEDSFGRKKSFYQDPQFLAWDLYSDDEINKIGDRMGVPKDIQNRREFIQEKMKKIAIQNNTLWMLTAGFATPVMSALICNQLEKPLSKPLFHARNANNNHLLAHFNNIAKNNQNTKIQENLNKFVSINQNKPLTEELLTDLSQIITDGMTPEAASAIKNDFINILKTDNRVINYASISEIAKESRKRLASLDVPENIIETLLPTPEQLTKYFDDEKGYLGNEFTQDQIDDIFQEYTQLIRSKMAEYNKKHSANPLPKEIESKIMNNLLLADKKNNPIYKGLTKETFAVLNPERLKTISIVANALTKLNTNLSLMDKYLLHQFGEIQETTIADYWNNTIDKFIKGLEIPKAEMEMIRGDRTLAAKTLRTSYENIASDKARYKQVTTDLVNNIAKLDKIIKKVDVDDGLFNPKKEPKLEKIINTTFKNFENDIKKVPNFVEGDMEEILDEVLGCRPTINSARTPRGSLKELYKNMAKNRLIEIKSSLFRILNALDTYRRIAAGDTSFTLALHSGMPREIKEETVELSKILGVSGHTSDYFTKFFQLVNPTPNLDDKSYIEIKNGKPIYKYFRPGRRNNMVTTPQDSSRFIEAMKLQYENNMFTETETAFGKNKNLLKEFKEYRRKVCSEIGNINFIENVFSKINHENNVTISDNMIFRLVGAPSDEVLLNYSKQLHNTGKWLKTFGTMGAVLLGVTVASQFFFGRMKPPKPAETQKGQQNA